MQEMAYYNQGTPLMHFNSRTRESANLITLRRRDHWVVTYVVHWGGRPQGAFVDIVYESHELYVQQRHDETLLYKLRRFLGWPDHFEEWNSRYVGSTANRYYVILLIY
jgi:hypothetical protein